MKTINKCIDELLQHAKNNISNMTIIFLANVKNVTRNRRDYQKTSIMTEFLSMTEFEELLINLQNFGYYTIPYFDIDKFFYDYFNGEFISEEIVLFESTQVGIGHAKDALIPAFCDIELILHTGPNAYANSICSNKYHWTKLLEQHDLPVPKSWLYDVNNGWLFEDIPNSSQLLISKPIYECASIGIDTFSVSNLDSKYEDILKTTALLYHQPLIVQEFILGYEVEVPVIINKKIPYIFPAVVLVKNGNPYMGNEFLSFQNIYDDDYNFCLLKSINSKWESDINEIVKNTIQLLGLDGYCRIDFRININGNCFITDINSYPHIVSHSSFSYAFKSLGYDESLLLPCIIGNVLSTNN